MTDLELIRLCAEAVGLRLAPIYTGSNIKGVLTVTPTGFQDYAPLHDDAQAMALVKKFCLHIDIRPDKQVSVQDPNFEQCFTVNTKVPELFLSRAIVECVAKMQAAKTHA